MATSYQILFALFLREDEAIRVEARWAIVGLAHRIGRTALREELERTFTEISKADKTPDAIVDKILSQSGDEAREHFALFYERPGANQSHWLSSQDTLH